MNCFSRKPIKKLSASVFALLLFASSVLYSCDRGDQVSNTTPGVSENIAPGIPDSATYGWSRDAGFSNLSSDEQLERLSVSIYHDERHSRFYYVTSTQDGSVYATGQVFDDNGGDALLVKYDNKLNQTAVITSSADGDYWCPTIDGSGNIFVISMIKNEIVKYSPDMVEVDRSEAHPNIMLRSMSIADDSSFYVCGWCETDNEGMLGSYGYLAKYNRDLELLQFVTWSENGQDIFDQVVTADDGSIYVVGKTYRGADNSRSESVISHYDKDLVVLESITRKDGDENFFSSLVVAPDKSLYVLYRSRTYSSSGINNSSDLIVQYDSNLSIINELSLSEINNWFPTDYWPSAHLNSLAIDSGGFIYACGTTYRPSTGGDGLVVLLSSDLEIINCSVWSASNRQDFLSLTLTEDGGVFIVGEDQEPGGSVKTENPLEPDIHIQALIIR